jgi:hypothetical protein
MKVRPGLSLLTAACFALAPVTVAHAGKPARSADTTPPTVSITAPGAGVTVAGTVTVSGKAADNSSLTSVAVKVDAGAYKTATGTSAWSAPVDSTAYADGTHTITAQATDGAGNRTTATVTVTVQNAAATPPADTTAPTVAFAAPTAGATLSGTATVSGSAADDTSVVAVATSVDGGTWTAASGTTSWSWAWNTTALTNGTHTVAVRATDAAGNATVASRSFTVSNTSGSPTVVDSLTTPEGAKILVYSDASGWTAQQVYDLLRPNAYELDKIGPSLTVKVQAATSSQTSTSVSTSGGIYTSFRATLYLQAKAGSTFTSRPDQIVAHEYGHVWTMYHLYLTRQGDWSPWLSARGLLGDSRVDSSYNWSKNEMIADDYRMLFGTSAAISEAGYINSEATDPRLVPGLKDFFLNGWAK